MSRMNNDSISVTTLISRMEQVKQQDRAESLSHLLRRISAVIDEMKSIQLVVESYANEGKSDGSIPSRIPPLLFYDLETTGNNKKTINIRITQIACVAIVDGQEHEFDVYVDPDAPVLKPTDLLDDVVARMDNVTLSETKDGNSSDSLSKSRSMISKDLGHSSMFDAGQRFIKFIREVTKDKMVNGKIYMLAHNGKSCDSRVLLYELERNGLSMPSNIMFVDTLEVFKSAIRAVKHKAPNDNTLGGVYRAVMKEGLAAAHNALFDSKAMVTITKGLLRGDYLNMSMQDFFDHYISSSAEPIGATLNRIHGKK